MLHTSGTTERAWSPAYVEDHEKPVDKTVFHLKVAPDTPHRQARRHMGLAGFAAIDFIKL